MFCLFYLEAIMKRFYTLIFWGLIFVVSPVYSHISGEQILWQDIENNLAITKTLSPAYSDYLVLIDGLHEHDMQMLGRTDIDIKPFCATLHNEYEKQVNGVIGAFGFGGFTLLKIDLLDCSPELFSSLMEHVEQFVLKNGVSNVYVQVLDKHKRLLELFLSLGYLVKDTRLDLATGNNIYNLYKPLKNALPKDTRYVFRTKWLSTNAQEHRKVWRGFFTGHVREGSLEVFDIDVESKLKVGVFVRGKSGKLMGGCYATVNSEAKIPHVYINMIWIHESLRGRKLSKKCMNFMEAIAKEHGCVYSKLSTSDHYAPWLYEKLGYTALCKRPDSFYGVDGKPYGAYVYRKKLVPEPENL